MSHFIYGLYKTKHEYLTNSIEDGLYYIGITTDIVRRKKAHISQNDNVRKMRYIKKYGIDIRILFTCETEKEALDRESFLIKWFGRIEDGGILTNLYPSGEIKFKERNNFFKDHTIETLD